MTFKIELENGKVLEFTYPLATDVRLGGTPGQQQEACRKAYMLTRVYCKGLKQAFVINSTTRTHIDTFGGPLTKQLKEKENADRAAMINHLASHGSHSIALHYDIENVPKASKIGKNAPKARKPMVVGGNILFSKPESGRDTKRMKVAFDFTGAKHTHQIEHYQKTHTCAVFEAVTKFKNETDEKIDSIDFTINTTLPVCNDKDEAKQYLDKLIGEAKRINNPPEEEGKTEEAKKQEAENKKKLTDLKKEFEDDPELSAEDYLNTLRETTTRQLANLQLDKEKEVDPNNPFAVFATKGELLDLRRAYEELQTEVAKIDRAEKSRAAAPTKSIDFEESGITPDEGPQKELDGIKKNLAKIQRDIEYATDPENSTAFVKPATPEKELERLTKEKETLLAERSKLQEGILSNEKMICGLRIQQTRSQAEKLMGKEDGTAAIQSLDTLNKAYALLHTQLSSEAQATFKQQLIDLNAHALRPKATTTRLEARASLLQGAKNKVLEEYFAEKPAPKPTLKPGITLEEQQKLQEELEKFKKLLTPDDATTATLDEDEVGLVNAFCTKMGIATIKEGQSIADIQQKIIVQLLEVEEGLRTPEQNDILQALGSKQSEIPDRIKSLTCDTLRTVFPNITTLELAKVVDIKTNYGSLNLSHLNQIDCTKDLSAIKAALLGDE